jgi:hypothetical protein
MGWKGFRWGAALPTCVTASMLLAACGSSSPPAKPSPPPARVSVTLTVHGPRATPESVGFRKPGIHRTRLQPPANLEEPPQTVVFTIHNQLDHASRLEVHEGPFVNDDVNSDLVPAHGTGALKTTFHAGIYQLDAENVPAQVNGQLYVGEYRGN